MKSGKLVLTGILALLFVSTASAAVTSVDLLEFQSNNDFYDGPVYIISTTSNYNTDEFHYFLDNQELSQGVSGEVQNTVTLDITSQTSKAVYGTRETGKQSIRKFDTTSFLADIQYGTETEIYNRVNNNEKVQNTCVDLEGNGIDRYDYFVTDHWGLNYQAKVFCVKKGEQLGNVGEIASNPKDVFKTVWKLTNNAGKVEKATISNANMGEGVCERIGPNSRVCFQGAVSSGKNSPVPTDELVLHSNEIAVNNGFRIIDRADYQGYLDAIPRMSSKIDDWGSGEANFFDDTVSEDEVVSEVNQKADEAASSHDSSEFTDARFTGSDIGSGKIELTVESGIWPQFTVELRACRNIDLSQCNAFVNIKRTVGEPKITDVSSKKFTELETGRVQVTYKNVGGAEGSFSARVSSCGQGFSFTGVAERAVLKPGETKTVSFPISFSSQSNTTGTITKSCTVQVEELGTGETVSTSVQVTGEQQSECTPGTQFKKTQVVEVEGENLERDVVYECNQNGLGTSKVKTCGVGEQAVAQGSTYQCLEEGGNEGGGTSTSDCTVTWVNNPVGNNIEGPDIGCHVNKLVSGVYGIFTVTAMFFAFLAGYGLRIPIAAAADLKGGAISILGRSVKAQWIIGIITGFLFAWLIAGLLTNPIVKWALLIGVPIYIIVKAWFFGPEDVIQAFLPI